MKVCNTTLADLYINEKPLWENGFTWHHLGLIISAVFGLISVIVALYLIVRHATHYSKPTEQKHIIRILLMIPVYSTVSFLSYLNYRHAIYYEVLRDCYEAFAIASFFTLLCHYIAPDLHQQKVFFRSLKPINWFWSVFGLQKCTGGKNRGPLRIPRSGLTWFNVIWVAVFQYCLIRVLFTIVSVITQYFGRYCEQSLNPEYAHIWVMAFEAASVTVAMFCLIQFYLQLKDDLAAHRPFLKVLCIKLVIFFSFWQTLVISFLSSGSGPLQPTETLAYPDIKIGIPSTLLCVEMAIFSVMHLFAFPWKPYTLQQDQSTQPKPTDRFEPANLNPEDPPARYQGGFMGLKAIGDAFNPWDILKATARGFRWLFVGRRNRFEDTSYSSEMNAPAGRPEQQHLPIYAKMTSKPATSSAAPLVSQHGSDSDTAGLLSNADPAQRPGTADHNHGQQQQQQQHQHESGIVPPRSEDAAADDHHHHHHHHPALLRVGPSAATAPSPYTPHGETTTTTTTTTTTMMPAPASYGGHDNDDGAGAGAHAPRAYFTQAQSGIDTAYHSRGGDGGGGGGGYGGGYGQRDEFEGGYHEQQWQRQRGFSSSGRGGDDGGGGIGLAYGGEGLDQDRRWDRGGGGGGGGGGQRHFGDRY